MMFKPSSRKPYRNWLDLALVFCLVFPALGHIAQAQTAPLLSNSSVTSQQVKNTVTPSSVQRTVVQGRLSNGLRYAILHRRGEETGVAFRLRVTGGFLAEHRPGEQGLAHLIEHLVFHSPTQKAPNELRRFRQVGFPLALPEPAGGTTTWRESDYFVVSRTNMPADIDKLLELFREVFSELTFRADAVDEQRAEVIREMSDKQLGNDIYASYIAALAPGSPTDIIEAQNSEDAAIANIDKIRGLYNRLYRPENVTLVLVGDVEADQMKAIIESRFGNWKGDGPTRKPALIPIFQANRIKPISYSSFRHGRNIAFISNISRLQPVPSSRTRQTESRLLDLIAMRAINDRLALSQKEFSPGKSGIFIENGEQGHRVINLWDNFAPGQWKSAVGELVSLSCDLRTVGFSDAEWTMAKQNIVQELEERVDGIAKLPNFELARELSDVLTDGRQLISSEELFNYAQTWLPTLSAKEGSEWWQRQWGAGIEHIRLETAEQAGVDEPEAAIRTAAENGIQGRVCKVRLP